jgi:hypothetical protein
MSHKFRIASFLLAFGAFFLPFLAEPFSRAHSDMKSLHPTLIRETAKRSESVESDKKRDRAHAAFCESVRGDVALGVF